MNPGEKQLMCLVLKNSAVPLLTLGKSKFLSFINRVQHFVGSIEIRVAVTNCSISNKYFLCNLRIFLQKLQEF